MKSIKKAIYFGTITLVIVGLLMASTANIIAQDSETNENKVITQTINIDIKPSDCVKSQPVENKVIYRQPSNTLGTPVVTAITPTISDSGSDIVLGFNSPENENVYFIGSTDFGQTWTSEMMGWMLDAPPSLPDVDGCGDGRLIGTFVPDSLDTNGGALYKVWISEASVIPDGYTCASWPFGEHGYTDFIDVACGGYTAVDPAENEWAYGGSSMIGDDVDLGSQTGFFSYQFNAEGNAWIYKLAQNPGDFNGATSTSMDIDQDTLYSYAVYNYDNQGNMDILLLIFDFGQWGVDQQGYPIHENGWEETLLTSGNDNNLDVSAFQKNVIIVSERDGAIVAYHANGLHNLGFSEVTIATAGQDPRVSHYDEKMAVCEFINNGDLYFSNTEDGGVTWSTPELVSEEPDVQNGDVCPYAYVYESEDTIYFAPTDFSQAILTIESISGGIGVSAVVKNVGTAAAENVDWSIVTAGTVFLGGEKTGTIASLAPGASTTIKTGLMLGFGTIDVTVTLGTVTKEASGKLLLFYIIGLA